MVSMLEIHFTVITLTQCPEHPIVLGGQSRAVEVLARALQCHIWHNENLAVSKLALDF